MTNSKKVFNAYIIEIYKYIAKKAHIFYNFKKYTKEDVKECNDKIVSAFNLYEEIRASAFIPKIKIRKNNKFNCSLNDENNTFPCIGSFKYRNKIFPIFADDYGMTDFIEIKVKDKWIQIDTLYDWYYAIDLYYDLDRFISASTVEECEKILQEIEKSNWFSA